jgi:uncharacterized membrane protein
MNQSENSKLTAGVMGMICATILLNPALPARAQSPCAQNYVIRAVDVPADPELIVYNYLNNSGIFVQQYQSPVGAPFPFDQHVAVWEQGVWSVIDVPGAIWSGPSGVNSQGQVAITYARADGVIRMAVWQGGRLEDLPEIPGFQYGGNGFNEKGQIAGNAVYADGSVHGFLGKARQYEIFDYPAANLLITLPGKINDAGIVVGEYDVAPLAGTGIHAFLKDGSQVSNIDLPGTDGTGAISINNRGVIVGYYLLGGVKHGFIRSQDNWWSFDVPGAVMTYLSDINDHGELVGVYQDTQGQTHGFVATPSHGNGASH